jgi:acyl carrier protein
MTDVERALALLVHAHAPANISANSAIEDPSMSLRNDLGFDLIALAELAVAIEDAFDLGIDLADLDECRTVGDLRELVATRSGSR